MALLILDALPAMTGKGAILHLLIEEGGITHSKVGRIELQKGRQAAVEVPDKWGRRLAKVLDGVKLENEYIRVWSQSSLSESAEEDHQALQLCREQNLASWLYAGRYRAHP